MLHGKVYLPTIGETRPKKQRGNVGEQPAKSCAFIFSIGVVVSHISREKRYLPSLKLT